MDDPLPHDPLSPDAKAAHHLLTELRTRIATQPLPYQHGVESRALTSMWEVFDHARAAMNQNPGCEKFARRATEVLNLEIRPLTARWHRAYEDGQLNGRDGADEFRGELQEVQAALRVYSGELHQMAYGCPATDALSPDVMSEAALNDLFSPLPFGFVTRDPEVAKIAPRIAADEAGAVADRRGGASPVPPGANAFGLALSGGGIRSASFALGVVQVLADRGFLDEVDFLSTVSGGGYTGSFLTQQLGAGKAQAEVAKPDGPDTSAICYVRQNARYLSGNNLKERWSMVTATLAGMFLNWSTPALVIVVLALVGAQAGPGFTPMRPTILAVGAILSLVATVVYGWGVRQGKKTSGTTGAILAGVLAATGLVAASWVLDFLHGQMWPRWVGKWHASGITALSLGAVATALPAIIRFVPVLKNPKIRQAVLKIVMVLAGLFVPCLAIILFYVLMDLGRSHQCAVLIVAGILAVVSIVIVDINLTSPHRLYRDGLARTFIQKLSDPDVPFVPLKDINPKGTGPYHILNATLNVPSSETAALKERGCDFFMFSKKWMGSISSNYAETDQWKANGKEVDLATAMAVSGAAFSTHMGLGSLPSLTALLTVLNVRLGFWIKKPGAPDRFQAPGFLCLLRELFGFGMTEKADWLNLSDGGHIENMSVYELLRRRCKFIICVDGESDPSYAFQGLMTLTRHARIDFGIMIAPLLDDIRPESATAYSKSHFHLCRILYPAGTEPEGTGLLLYLKLSVTGNESELIRRYRTNHPEFPHQTTLDQFFDQEQFEAYRQLGTHVAKGLFKPALMSGTQPVSVPDWFRRLAKNLLNPTPIQTPPPTALAPIRP